MDLEEMMGKPVGEMWRGQFDGAEIVDHPTIISAVPIRSSVPRNSEGRCASHVGVHLAQNGVKARGASGA
jgi:hypothetical protein